MVSTLRCGRSNPGSNPGYGRISLFDTLFCFINIFLKVLFFVFNFKARAKFKITNFEKREVRNNEICGK